MKVVMHPYMLQVLTRKYMEVSTCWHNPTAQPHVQISVEEALHTLRAISADASGFRNGKQLSRLAHKLSEEIVANQEESPVIADVSVTTEESRT